MDQFKKAVSHFQTGFNGDPSAVPSACVRVYSDHLRSYKASLCSRLAHLYFLCGDSRPETWSYIEECIELVGDISSDALNGIEGERAKNDQIFASIEARNAHTLYVHSLFHFINKGAALLQECLRLIFTKEHPCSRLSELIDGIITLDTILFKFNN